MAEAEELVIMAIVVIGAGLFGSVISRHLRELGHDVTVVADVRARTGSAAAGCLMRPSWATSMVKSGDYGRAVELLDRYYGVREVPLRVSGTYVKAMCSWVDPARVLERPSTSTWIGDLEACKEDSFLRRADVIVVATGSWVGNLVPSLAGRVEARGGWSMTFPGQLPEGFIRTWAPYKQIVAFNIGPDRVWVGDGTSLKPGSMTQDRREVSRWRMVDAVRPFLTEGQLVHGTMTEGLRPYVQDLKEPALVEEVSPGVIVATGGAKNGTLGAAWSARRVEEMLT